MEINIYLVCFIILGFLLFSSSELFGNPGNPNSNSGDLYGTGPINVFTGKKSKFGVYDEYPYDYQFYGNPHYGNPYYGYSHYGYPYYGYPYLNANMLRFM